MMKIDVNVKNSLTLHTNNKFSCILLLKYFSSSYCQTNSFWLTGLKQNSKSYSYLIMIANRKSSCLKL